MNLFSIQPALQHYDWGGQDFLSNFLNVPNTLKPIAELWYGVHPKGEAMASYKGREVPLSECLIQNGLAAPNYLLKLLDVQHMLSIQCHPDKITAEKGFQKENEQGIPLLAFDRVYRDNNHKPELMYALSDFYLMHGFDQAEHILNDFERIESFSPLVPILKSEGIKGLFEKILSAQQSEINLMLKPWGKVVKSRFAANELNKSQKDYWAAKAYLRYNKKGVCDRGIFCIYLLNLVHLNAGECIFQEAGLLHAYLEGQNVEIMANSDNVFRAGLTSKHMDIPSLMKHVNIKSIQPEIIQISDADRIDIPKYVDDFGLSFINSACTEITLSKWHTAICLEGSVEIRSEGERYALSQGRAVIILAGSYEIKWLEAGTICLAYDYIQ